MSAATEDFGSNIQLNRELRKFSRERSSTMTIYLSEWPFHFIVSDVTRASMSLRVRDNSLTICAHVRIGTCKPLQTVTLLRWLESEIASVRTSGNACEEIGNHNAPKNRMGNWGIEFSRRFHFPSAFRVPD